MTTNYEGRVAARREVLDMSEQHGPRYQIVRQGRTLRIVDCILDLEHPEAGAATCYIGGDAESEIVQQRAELVARALNTAHTAQGIVDASVKAYALTGAMDIYGDYSVKRVQDAEKEWGAKRCAST